MPLPFLLLLRLQMIMMMMMLLPMMMVTMTTQHLLPQLLQVGAAARIHGAGVL